MTTIYPAQIDTPASLPIASTQTPLDPSLFNALRGAIVNIEQTLGVNPAATFGTIGGALITLQNLINTSSGGVQIGGDLGGTNGAPLVIGIQGFPISNAAPTNGQILGFVGGAWAPINSNLAGAAGGDLGGNYPNPSVIKVNGVLYGSNPSTNTVPVVTSSNTITYQQISNAQINAAAAISVSKLASGVAAQVLLSNATPTPTWTTISGDIGFSNTGVTTVNKIQGVVISGTPSAGNVLAATSSSAASWQSAGGAVTLAGDVTGAGNANTVVKIRGVPVSANPVTNDGYALVSTAGTYVPTGVKPVFNVRNFGASPSASGATNSAAFANAIALKDLNNGGTIFVPAGVYHLSSPLDLGKDYCILQGEDGYYIGEEGPYIAPTVNGLGNNGTVLWFNNNTDGITTFSQYCQHTIESLVILGNGAHGTTGLKAQPVYNVNIFQGSGLLTLNKVWISNFDVGAAPGSAEDFQWNNLTISNCGTGLLCNAESTNATFTRMNIQFCNDAAIFSACLQMVWNTGLVQNNLRGVTIAGLSSSPIMTAQQIHLDGVWFENQGWPSMGGDGYDVIFDIRVFSISDISFTKCRLAADIPFYTMTSATPYSVNILTVQDSLVDVPVIGNTYWGNVAWINNNVSFTPAPTNYQFVSLNSNAEAPIKAGYGQFGYSISGAANDGYYAHEGDVRLVAGAGHGVWARSVTNAHDLVMISSDILDQVNIGDQVNVLNTNLLAKTNGTFNFLTGSGQVATISQYNGIQNVVNVKNYGALGNNSNDDTTFIQAAMNVIKPGDILYFPKGNYVITSPLVLPTLSQTAGIGGFTILGDGSVGASAAYENAGSVIIAHFPTNAGTDGYMASIANDPGGSASVVTFTSVAGFGTAAQGDQITITNAANPHNNGVYTIITVSAHSLTYFSFNYDVPFYPIYPILPDANNHSIHWQIGKPVIKAYTRDTIFKNMVINGGSSLGFLGAGCCIDSTFSGFNNVTVGNNTNMQFENCYFLYAVDGVKIGDFSGYITGASGLSGTILTPNWYPGNCDLYRFEKCTFDFMSNAGIHIPNTTGQSKVHQLDQCVFEFSNYGLKIASGSFNMVNSSSEANLVCDIALLTTFDTCAINYYSSENAPRLIEVAAGTGANETVSLNNVRADTQSAYLASDGYFIRFSSSGIYSISNSNFYNADNNRWSIGLATFNNVPNLLDLTITNCSIPSVTPKNAVTDLTGGGNVWYSSFASLCTQGTAFTSIVIPNGIQRANTIATGITSFPSLHIPNSVTPNASITLSNGTTNNLTNPLCTSVLCVGPTASVTLTGIGSGEDGQNLELIFGFNQTVQFTHDSGSSTSGNKIFCPNSANVILNTPGSGGFNAVKLRYSTALDSGNGGWYLLSSYVSNLSGDVIGTTGANTVTKIQGVSVSTNAVANDGYALVSIGGTYIPTGVMTTFNVKNFGASPSASAATNSAAFANAIAQKDFNNGGVVFIPAGVYKLNASLDLGKAYCVLQGEVGTYLGQDGYYVAPTVNSTSTYGSVLWFNNSTHGITTNSPLCQHTIESLVILGNGAHNTTGLGLGTLAGYPNGAAILTLDKVMISSFDVGANPGFSEDFQWSNLTIWNCGTGLLCDQAPTNGTFDKMNLQFCLDGAIFAAEIQMLWNGGLVQNNFRGVTFAATNGNGIPESVYLKAVWFENQGYPLIGGHGNDVIFNLTNNIENITFTGCRLVDVPFTTLTPFGIYEVVNLTVQDCKLAGAVTGNSFWVGVTWINNDVPYIPPNNFYVRMNDVNSQTALVAGSFALPSLAPGYLATDTSGNVFSTTVYNVKAYGAVGNGSHDDTAAINAAIAAMPSGGARLYFPAGTYLVSSMITVQALYGNIIEGDGTFNTTLYFPSANSTHPAVLRLQNCYGLQVRDMWIKGAGSPPVSILTSPGNVGDNVLHVNQTSGIHDGYGVTVIGTSPSITGQRYNVVSHTTNTITIDPPLMFAAVNGNGVYACANSIIQIYNQSPGAGQTTNDNFNNIFVGTDGAGPAAHYGLDINGNDGYGVWCNVGTPSDGNNDLHNFYNFWTINVSTGVRIGNLNSLTNGFTSCNIGGSWMYGIESVSGNFQVNGGTVYGQVSDYSVIGYYTHPIYVSNTDGEDQSPVLVSPRYTTTITSNVTDGYDGYWGGGMTGFGPIYYKMIPVSTVAFFWGANGYSTGSGAGAYLCPININLGSSSVNNGEQMYVAQVDYVNNILYCIAEQGAPGLHNSYPNDGYVITITTFGLAFNMSNCGNAYSCVVSGTGNTSANPSRKFDVVGTNHQTLSLSNCRWGADNNNWCSIRFLESSQVENYQSAGGSCSVQLANNAADWNMFEISNCNWQEMNTVYYSDPNNGSGGAIYSAINSSFVTRLNCFETNNKYGSSPGIGYGGLQGIAGISGLNQNPTSNLGGQVSISGASTTTAAVGFPYINEADGNYKVMLSFDSFTGTVASKTLYATSKGTGGFTVNVDVAPGAGASVVVNWFIFR